MKKNLTQDNLNLLKVISMFLIVVWHCIIHGNVLGNVHNSLLNIAIYSGLFLIIIHVNCFIIITGYFQHKSKFKFNKLLRLYIEVVFYSIVIYLITSVLKNEAITIQGITNNFLPTVLTKYWFMNCYILLYIFSDYLNIIISKVSKQEAQKGLIILFTIFSIFPFIFGERYIGNNGYTLVQFILMYFIGAYLYEYPLKKHKYFEKKSNKQYLITMIIVFIVLGFSNNIINIIAEKLIHKEQFLKSVGELILVTKYSYARPLVVLQSIAFFEIFNSIKFKNNFVTKLAPILLGTYLITENEYIRPILYKYLLPKSGHITSFSFIFKLIGYSICVFVICLLIDYLRVLLFKLFRLIWKKFYHKKRS